MRRYRLSGLVVLLLLLAVASCTYASSPLPPRGTGAPAAPTDAPGQGGPAPAYVMLAENLTKAGARVQATGEISQPFFSVSGRILRVNGADVQTFSYADPTVAEGEAATVSPDGNTVAGSQMAWTAPPHFFRKDRMIALYVGKDLVVLGALEAALGPQFAGTPTASAVTPTAPAGQIAGLVWHDICGVAGGEGGTPAKPTTGCVQSGESGYRADGILGSGEPGLPDVRVSLGVGACPAGEQVSAVTGPDGKYAFTSLAAGAYCIYVNALSAANAALLPGEWTYPSGGEGGTASATVMLNEGQAKGGVNFGWDYKFLPVPVTPTPAGNPAATPVAGATPRACTDRATMIRDVTIPDNSRIPAGQVFDKIWQLRNVGTCTWDEGYALVFANGDQMDGPGAVALLETVKPGATVDISVTLTSPAAPGVHKGDWQLRNAAGAVFGIGRTADRTFWVQIVTTAATPAPAVTAAVPSSTPSPAPTATHIVPATAAPTAAPPTVAPPTPPPSSTIQRIVMPPGSVLTSFSTNLTADQPKAYVLEAETGQTMNLVFDNTTTVPIVYDPDGTIVTPVTTGGDGRFSYRLDMSGDYVIVVEGGGPTVISIELPPADAAAAGSVAAG